MNRPTLKILQRLFACLTGLVLTFGVVGRSYADPTVFADDNIQFDVPDSLKVIELLNDDRASVYTFVGTRAPIDVYVLKLDAEGVEHPDLHGKNVFRQFIAIEKHLDLTPKGRTRIKLAGCNAISWAYKDGDDGPRSRVAGCQHPTLPRYDVFHLDVDASLADDSDEIVQAFHKLLYTSVALLDANGAPLARDGEAPNLKGPAPADDKEGAEKGDSKADDESGGDDKPTPHTDGKADVKGDEPKDKKNGKEAGTK